MRLEKLTKRLLPLLLALALALGTAQPTAAERAPAPSVNWDDFYITVQPEGRAGPYGTVFTLRVEAHAPQGVRVEYEWRGPYLPAAGEEAVFVCAPGDRFYPGSMPVTLIQSVSENFYCYVWGYEEDENGNLLSSWVLESDTVTITCRARLAFVERLIDSLYKLRIDATHWIETAFPWALLF